MSFLSLSLSFVCVWVCGCVQLMSVIVKDVYKCVGWKRKIKTRVLNDLFIYSFLHSQVDEDV